MAFVRHIILVAALTGLASSLLTGCGVRGPLEPPPGSEDAAHDRDKTFVLDDLI